MAHPHLAATVMTLTGLVSPAVFGEMTPLSTPLVRQGFERIAYERGVTAYKHPGSKIIRIAAEGRVGATPQQVIAALIDYPRQVGVMDRLSKSRVLDRRACSLHVYQRLNLPVIDDRDFTLKVRWGTDRGVRWVRYRAVSNRGPAPQRGVVRVSTHQGSWQVKPLEGGSASWVRFQARIDLSGWLPRWMAKSGAGKELPELFTSVRKLVKRDDERRIACITPR